MAEAAERAKELHSFEEEVWNKIVGDHEKVKAILQREWELLSGDSQPDFISWSTRNREAVLRQEKARCFAEYKMKKKMEHKERAQCVAEHEKEKAHHWSLFMTHAERPPPPAAAARQRPGLPRDYQESGPVSAPPPPPAAAARPRPGLPRDYEPSGPVAGSDRDREMKEWEANVARDPTWPFLPPRYQRSKT